MDIDSLSLEELRQLDQITAAFEKSWNSNSPPRIEDYLEQVNETVRAAFLTELLYLEVVYRKRRSESPTTHEYLNRFPNCNEIVQSIFNLADTSIGSISAEATQTFSRVLQKNNAAQELIGKQLGRYLVEKCLGEGGEGAVYLALDPTLERHVAIKVPHETQFSTEESQNRYLQEARTLAKLRHSRIVSILDVGQSDEGKPYIVMEYLEGGSLRDKLKEHKYSLGEVVTLLADVATALHFAHKQGFVHRDLKPSNVLLDKEGHPYLVDFGLALHEELQRKRKGDFSGTISYMAPEQIRGEAHYIDGRADIWACGVMLYEMLTNRRPFESDSVSELKGEILKREPKPPRQRDESIPLELEHICLKCLAKDVTLRYTTAIDLATALQDIAANLESDVGHGNRRGVGVPARKPHLSTQGSNKNRKRKFFIILLAFAFLIGLGAVIISLKTKNGTLIVEVDDPEATIQVLDADGQIIIGRKDAKDSYTFSLKPGNCRVCMTKNGIEVFAKELSIIEGDKAIISASAIPTTKSSGNIILADFEGSDFGDWKAEGKAFGSGPANGSLQDQYPVSRFAGNGFANSFHGGNASIGKLTSPEFAITCKYITFLIGGGCQPEDIALNLLVDGNIVRTTTPIERSDQLVPLGWDVSDLENKQARIEIVDKSIADWGHILIDQIEMSDVEIVPILPKYVPSPLVAHDDVVADSNGLDYADGKVKGVPIGSRGIWLDTLDLSTIEQCCSPAQSKKTVGGLPLVIGGRAFVRGIGCHATSRWRIDLKEAAVKFLAMVGSHDASYNRGSVSFEVWVDGKVVAKSGLMKSLQQAKKIEADLTGAKELLLLIIDGDDGNYCDNANWADAMIIIKPGGAKPESMQTSIQSRLDTFAPGWQIRNCGDEPTHGLRSEYAGKEYVFVTHPSLDRNTGCTLSKSISLPANVNSLLHLVVGHHPEGDFDLIVRADSKELLRKPVSNETAKNLWLTLDIDLSDYAGKSVNLELVNQPNGWNCESAYWAEMSILENKDKVTNYYILGDTDEVDYNGEIIKGLPVGSKGVWLDTLDLSEIKQSTGHAHACKSLGDHPLRIGGRTYMHGIGSHARSRWRIDLKEAAVKFLTMVGVDDETGQFGSVCFEVWVDGKKVAESGLMTGRQKARKLEADLTGAKELLLQIDDGGDGNSRDSADWADAIIFVKPGGTKPESICSYDNDHLSSEFNEFAPGWEILNCGDYAEIGLHAELGGKKNVFVTHPFDPSTGCTLRKTIKVTDIGKTELHLVVGHDPQGDFDLIVRANGKELLRKPVNAGTAKNNWLTLDIDLSDYAGKSVMLELINQPTGWAGEMANWAEISIREKGDNTSAVQYAPSKTNDAPSEMP